MHGTGRMPAIIADFSDAGTHELDTHANEWISYLQLGPGTLTWPRVDLWIPIKGNWGGEPDP